MEEFALLDKRFLQIFGEILTKTVMDFVKRHWTFQGATLMIVCLITCISTHLGLFIACVDTLKSLSPESESQSVNKGSEIKRGGIPL